jgi:hypothetical protein
MRPLSRVWVLAVPVGYWNRGELSRRAACWAPAATTIWLGQWLRVTASSLLGPMGGSCWARNGACWARRAARAWPAGPLVARGPSPEVHRGGTYGTLALMVSSPPRSACGRKAGLRSMQRVGGRGTVATRHIPWRRLPGWRPAAHAGHGPPGERAVMTITLSGTCQFKNSVRRTCTCTCLTAEAQIHRSAAAIAPPYGCATDGSDKQPNRL